MTALGIYTTETGMDYECSFSLEDQSAIARGPLPKSDVGKGVATLSGFVEVFAESEEEAKIKLGQKLGKGCFR